MSDYFRLTRTQTYSLVFALPLLLLYEAGAAWLSRTEENSLRNGADVLLRTLVAAGGIQGTGAFAGILLAIAAIVIFFERRRQKIPLRFRYFFGMAMESVVLALLFGLVVGTLTQWVLQGAGFTLAIQGNPMSALPLRDAVVLSLGAGIYEELAFRVILVGGLVGVFRASGLQRKRAGVFAAILAALLFSAFHYIGPYAYPLELDSFTFRLLAGLAFSALYMARGFGVAAWTHALYDVFLVIAGRG